MNNIKKVRLAVYIFLVILVLALAWQTVVYFQHRGKIGVDVVVLPSDSSLRLDGKSAKPGKIYLTPGNHTFVASRVYFDNDVENINTADITKGETIYMLPAANSSAAKIYLQQHPDIQQEREAAGGAESERIRELLLKKYPIISKLPQENLHYKIDYSVDTNQKFSLKITTYGIINGPSDYTTYVEQTKAYKQEALDFLKQNGVTPNSYPIAYVPNL